MNCEDCGYRSWTLKPCVCWRCRRSESEYCANCRRECLTCGDSYCQNTALEILAENDLSADAPFRCENCQFDYEQQMATDLMRIA